MLIDCYRCEMRDVACDECVVTALLGAPPGSDLDEQEWRALHVLADADMVAPLRLAIVDSEAS
ncbi:MAG: hypothetical protein ACRDN9_11940 [Streptosporangiaceae bacterium]